MGRRKERGKEEGNKERRKNGRIRREGKKEGGKGKKLEGRGRKRERDYRTKGERKSNSRPATRKHTRKKIMKINK